MALPDLLTRLRQARAAQRVAPAAPVPVALETPADRDVPEGLKIASGYAWRLLLLGGLVWVSFQVLAYFSAISVPVALALLVAAFLSPIVRQMRRVGIHPTVAALIALLLMIGAVVGSLTYVGVQVAAEWPTLADQALTGMQQLTTWLASGPLGIDAAQIDGWFVQAREWITAQSSSLAGYAATVGGAFGSFFAGLATTLVLAFFFAAQGRELFLGLTNVVVPRHYRGQFGAASLKGWDSLVAYMRTQVIVSAVDAAGVALAAFALGVPMVAALFALTFFFSFIPVVGAVVAGSVAVALALVTQGGFSALLMLGAVVLVMQAEGNLLQPLLMGKAVDIHPVVILSGLTAGAVIGGILGALLAIPVVAFLSAFARGWSATVPSSEVTLPLAPKEEAVLEFEAEAEAAAVDQENTPQVAPRGADSATAKPEGQST